MTSYIIETIYVIESEGLSLLYRLGTTFGTRIHDVTKREGNGGDFDIAAEHFIAYDIDIGVCDFRMRMAMFVRVKDVYKSPPFIE